MQWYLAVLSKYADFSGRARRMEYWMYSLFSFLIGIGLVVIDEVAGLTKAANGLSPLNLLYTLGTIIPGIAVVVRRLHDIGKGGVWLLIVFIPLLGPIILLVFMVRAGDRGRNEFGPDPIDGRADRPEREGRRYDEYDDN